MIDERLVGRKPTSLDHARSAALPLTALTAWESLIENLGAPEMGSDEGSILIIGGAGGVGSIAIQIARRVCGLRVVATASREESRAYCLDMGAEQVLGHQEEPDEDFDYILSTTTPADIPRLAGMLKPLGRIGFILPPPMPLDLSPLFPIRGSVHFELMFTRPRHECEPERQGDILDRVAALADARILRTTLTETLDWSDFRAAYERIGSGHTMGKIVMTLP